MKTKKFLPVLLVLLSLSCNYVMRAFEQPTPTPAVPTATSTPQPSVTPQPSPTPASTLTPSPTAVEAGLYIPPSCQGQPLATVIPSTEVAIPTPQLDPNPPIPRDEQLQVFDDMTSRIKKVYLYPDFNGVDWPGLVTKSRAKVSAGLDTSAFYDEMDQLVQALGDDHSQFQAPNQVAQLDAELSGHNDFVGIGIQFIPLLEKKSLTILAVFPDSPAEHAGLKAHDSILAVDGLPLVENGQGYYWRVRGPQCSASLLTVQSPGGEPRQVMLIRNHITTTAPVVAQMVKTTDGSRIGYIFLPSFFDETLPAQVHKALLEFGTLDGLVIDNRANGGGSSDVVEPILSFFAHGKLGSSVTRTRTSPLIVEADPVNNSQEVPLVVLVGQDTASFGEIFSGILQDTGRAKVAGQTTLGNVEILHPYSFADGSRIWVAEERFVPPVSHADWEKDGIRPDLEAYAPWETFSFETDPGIAAALQLLGHK
ncbi:MAG TPA: S41 family peptidase [Anaerolineales bacterium]|jgi:C-terminal peptidase prc